MHKISIVSYLVGLLSLKGCSKKKEKKKKKRGGKTGNFFHRCQHKIFFHQGQNLSHVVHTKLDLVGDFVWH